MAFSEATGQRNFHIAFALGGFQPCVPTWGGKYAIDDPEILEPLNAIKALGGELIVATGKKTQDCKRICQENGFLFM